MSAVERERAPESSDFGRPEPVVVRMVSCLESTQGLKASGTRLAEKGISTICGDFEALQNELVVFLFDHVGAGPLSALEALAQRGRGRVLAAHIGPTALDGDVKWEIMARGAGDVIDWSQPDGLESTVRRLRRWHEVDALIRSPLVADNLVGSSTAWLLALREIVEAGRFTNASILVTGETGTGKELAARLIHSLDPRPDKGELVVLDCTTIVPTLSGSEFFGHDKGAFTGAVANREGVFALADGGTLFLDEVGELPLGLQSQVLRAIQEGAYKPVGSNRWRQTNFRLICATNRDLSAEQEDGSFRRDLYHRIACWPIHLPPLRERSADILALFRYFAGRCGVDGAEPDEAVRQVLLGRSYPGNVRELKQLTEQICFRHTQGGRVTPGALPPSERPGLASPLSEPGFLAAIHRAVELRIGLRGIRRWIEDVAVDHAVDQEGGSLQKAAITLGVTPRALQMRRAGRRPGQEEDAGFAAATASGEIAKPSSSPDVEASPFGCGNHIC